MRRFYRIIASMWGEGRAELFQTISKIPPTMLLHQLMENLGTASFAISGALAALNKRLDVFGVLVLTFATAVGGGPVCSTASLG